MKAPRPIALVASALIGGLCLTACGPEPRQQGAELRTKIYRGDQLSPELFPQIVQIVVYLNDGLRMTCSGTAIGAHAVLTAAHCYTQAGIAASAVRVLGVEQPVSEVIPAAGFRAEGGVLFEDAAIVKTAAPLGVPTLPLLISLPPVQQQTLYIYGFGLNEEGASGLLRSGAIEPEIVTPNHLIDLVEGGQNTCAGDSGGPVVAAVANGDGATAYGVVAVTSSGSGAACTDSETAYYTNLQSDALVEFIAANVSDAVFF